MGMRTRNELNSMITTLNLRLQQRNKDAWSSADPANERKTERLKLAIEKCQQEMKTLEINRWIAGDNEIKLEDIIGN